MIENKIRIIDSENRIGFANEKEEDCHHYSIFCKKFGYINEKGEVVKLGNYTFEEIKTEIDWKPNEE